MKRVELNVPTPILLGTQYRFWRSEIEHEKIRLRAEAMGREAPPYAKPEIDVLVPSDVFATEFGISKRTLARRLKELAKQEKATG